MMMMMTVYRPSTNGMVERYHRTLNSILGKIIREDNRKWCEKVSIATAAYRASVRLLTEPSHVKPRSLRNHSTGALENMTGGHLGRRRTEAQVQRRGYWPSWSEDVCRFLCCYCRTTTIGVAVAAVSSGSRRLGWRTLTT